MKKIKDNILEPKYTNCETREHITGLKKEKTQCRTADQILQTSQTAASQ